MNVEKKAFASVVVLSPLREKHTLTYAVPVAFRYKAREGMRVLVPLSTRVVLGIITGFSQEYSQNGVKEIWDLLDEEPFFSPELLRLWQWTADYYLASPSEVFLTMLPEALRGHLERFVTLTKQERGKADGPELTKFEKEICDYLSAHEKASTKTLVRRFPRSGLYHALRRLEAKGLICLQERWVERRNPVQPSRPGTEPRLDFPSYDLTASQEKATAVMLPCLAEPTFAVFLLHGVTGSGKTDVYLRAAEEVVSRGRRVLILVPEIALTHQLVERVHQRFGEKVALLHSALSPGARVQEWRKVARGQAATVVGVRSAVFVPVPELGLIVVDEEHDPAYKQEEGVRYNARDMAVVRAKLTRCPVILGSATPSVESHLHGRRGRYTLLRLHERVQERHLPRVEVVDLRREARDGSPGEARIFSRSLQQALRENLAAGNQSLLFLNRRGFANYLQCRLCGCVLVCPHCSVTLTFHLRGRSVRCHYCGFHQRGPDVCPQCSGATLEGCGIGTQQVEQALFSFLPQAHIARMDRDTVRRKGELPRMLTAWRNKEIDILVGTQMVTKGHDIPGVTLVGVVLADLSLNVPDFRAAERTFQLLTQVAGRAGRGEEEGRVIIQTYRPHHYSIRWAACHDFPHFADRELRYRKALGYPPFSRMINIRLEGSHLAGVEKVAQLLGEKLRQSSRGRGAPLVLGPAPAPLEKLKGRYRWQVLVRGVNIPALHQTVRQGRQEILPHARSHGVRFLVDVDPYSML